MLRDCQSRDTPGLRAPASVRSGCETRCAAVAGRHKSEMKTAISRVSNPWGGTQAGPLRMLVRVLWLPMRQETPAAAAGSVRPPSLCESEVRTFVRPSGPVRLFRHSLQPQLQQHCP